mgnify:CR=1 FL=1
MPAPMSRGPSRWDNYHGTESCDVADLIELLKKNPGQYNFGSSGIGTYPHLAAEMFKLRAGGLFVVHIPYRGASQIVPDVMSGQVPIGVVSATSAIAQARAGKLRALAITAAKRSPLLPEVPTTTEAGMPKLRFSAWLGVLAPSATPAALVDALNKRLVESVQSPEVTQKLLDAGFSVIVDDGGGAQVIF